MHWTIKDVNVAIRVLISIPLSYLRRERRELQVRRKSVKVGWEGGNFFLILLNIRGNLSHNVAPLKNFLSLNSFGILLREIHFCKQK